jgi:hypothetical protein
MSARERPVYVITLRPLPRVDAVKALRRMLKYTLRQCGLRAVEVREEPPT